MEDPAPLLFTWVATMGLLLTPFRFQVKIPASVSLINPMKQKVKAGLRMNKQASGTNASHPNLPPPDFSWVAELLIILSLKNKNTAGVLHPGCTARRVDKSRLRGSCSKDVFNRSQCVSDPLTFRKR